MKTVCILGGGTGGATLALELLGTECCNVILIDVDSLDKKFNDKNLERIIECDSSMFDETSTGHGFGGTSNYWHGVVTHLDDEDYEEINSEINFDLQSDLLEYERSAMKYYAQNADFETNHHNSQPLFRYILLKANIVIKKYIVQIFPTRFRSLLRKNENNPRLQLVENAVAIKLAFDDKKVKFVEVNQEGVLKEIYADFFVVSLGALESPRILHQSFSGTVHENTVIGQNFLDHPYVTLGKITLQRPILYRQHGTQSKVSNVSQRNGLRIPKHLRNIGIRNNSIFIKPYFNESIASYRKSFKLLILNPKLRDVLKLCFSAEGLKTIVSLLIEKTGIGYYTRTFLVTCQIEEVPSNKTHITFDKEADVFGRIIPKITHQNFSDIEYQAIEMQKIFAENILSTVDFTPFTINSNDILSGAHHAGTCRIGTRSGCSVVDSNLKYHGLQNLFVCDASVFPKIGNANLSLTISMFACRLASYIRNLLK